MILLFVFIINHKHIGL